MKTSVIHQEGKRTKVKDIITNAAIPEHCMPTMRMATDAGDIDTIRHILDENDLQLIVDNASVELTMDTEVTVRALPIVVTEF